MQRATIFLHDHPALEGRLQRIAPHVDACFGKGCPMLISTQVDPEVGYWYMTVDILCPQDVWEAMARRRNFDEWWVFVEHGSSHLFHVDISPLGEEVNDRNEIEAEFDRDHDWLVAHWEDLMATYRHRWIGVYEESVVGVADDLDPLMEDLGRRGVPLGRVVVKRVDEGMEVV